MQNANNQPVWKSSKGFIFAITGAAVGLGNIWRFPYIAGEGGGSAFLFLYLFFVLILGLPIMIAEIGIGKIGRDTPINSLKKLADNANANKNWKYLGVFGLITLFLILSFYSVVAGWSFAYFGKSVSGEFVGKSASEIGGIFNAFLANWQLLLICHTIFISLTMGVVALGVTKGLERLNNWLMPMLYIILILLVVYSITTPGFIKAMDWLFYPRLENITWSVILDALGHAFFTLALGATALMAYGAYMPEDMSLPKTVSLVAGLDVAVGILAGVSIFSIVFSHGLDVASGPGLMFVTLAIGFGNVSGGAILGASFFLLLLVATWTSSINLAEPMIATLEKKLNSRVKASLIIGLGVWSFGILSALSFNLLSDFYPLNWIFPDKTVFDIVSSIPSEIFLTLGGLLTGIFAFKILNQEQMLEVLHGNAKIYKLWGFAIKYISTPLLVVVLIMGLKKYI